MAELVCLMLRYESAVVMPHVSYRQIIRKWCRSEKVAIDHEKWLIRVYKEECEESPPFHAVTSMATMRIIAEKSSAIASLAATVRENVRIRTIARQGNARKARNELRPDKTMCVFCGKRKLNGSREKSTKSLL